jgi:hypothetical protein
MATSSAPHSQPDLRAKPAQAIANTANTLANALGGQLEAAEAAVRATLALLAKPELQTAAAKDPLLAQRLTAVTQQANANLASLDTKKTQLQQAVVELNKGLARFRQR